MENRGGRYVDLVAGVAVDGDRATADNHLLLRFVGQGRQGETVRDGLRPRGRALEGLFAWPPASCGTLSIVRYAGDITPEEAWQLLLDDPEAVLVDCRTEAEWRFVGVPDLFALRRDVVSSSGIAPTARTTTISSTTWRAGVRRASGRWSSCAVRATARSAPPRRPPRRASRPAYNVLDGFEGTLDEHGHRGATGWKAVGLPWRQS